MNDEFSFSEWLENAMKEHNLNQNQIATMSGHAPSCIRHYLTCQRFPSILIINDFLNLFGKKLIVVDKEK